MNARNGQSTVDAASLRMPHVRGTLWPATGAKTDVVRLDFGSQSGVSQNAVIPDRQLVETLAQSALFRKYQRAFQELTGLPLTLRGLESWRLAHVGNPNQNHFCALMARASRSCAACLGMQQGICEDVKNASCTLSCAFGLNETAVGVKNGREIVAYLLTGQVFFKPPGSRQINRVINRIKEWGLDFDASETVRCYNETSVVRWDKYQAIVRLLECFANQLGALAGEIVSRQQNAEPRQIRHAKRFIEANYQQHLSLPTVARQVGMNTFYFCKIFRKVTGMKFTRYLCRVRVEKAKNLLLTPQYHVSEIGYEVGFQSLTHFNRIFKSLTGQTPLDYRHNFYPH